MIHKKLLPGYSPPFEDELLSSFLFRLSFNHLIKPYSFTKYYFKSDIVWNRDIDKYILPNIKEKLEEITPLTSKDIDNLQLNSYQDLVFNGNINTSFVEGITNLGIYHRKRISNALYACPKCLKSKPYFKKEWRLHTSIICIKCKIHLIDCCPKCLSPIIFQRVDLGSKTIYNNSPIYQCWKCSFDLRETDITKASDVEIDYQKYINYTIEKGYNKHSNYSFLYFKILFIFLKKINTTSRNWNRIKIAMTKEYGIELNPLLLKDNPISINDKIKTLPLIYKLLQNWPTDFILFCKKYNIRYSDFSKDIGELPFWFYKIFKE